MGLVDEAVKADIEGEDSEDDEPAGDEVYEEADSIGCEPTP